jgi:hypothetical protein
VELKRRRSLEAQFSSQGQKVTSLVEGELSDRNV